MEECFSKANNCILNAQARLKKSSYEIGQKLSQIIESVLKCPDSGLGLESLLSSIDLMLFHPQEPVFSCVFK